MAIINGTIFNDNGSFFFPVLNGTSGDDSIFGFQGNDVLNGFNGNDFLDGGADADTMNGGDGNDTYIVDNTGDVAAESFNDALGGVDTVNASVNHTLGFGIENLNLTTTFSGLFLTGGIIGTGNENNNVINGNFFSNTLNGLGGNDVLNGGFGSDTLFGGNGNDTLDGGSGADTMNGGDGSDIYSVDDTGDVVSEFFNDALGGVDTVNSSVSFGPLGFGIENLNLTGSAAINGTGNSNNNVINGNSAANVIDGGTGADTMNAGDGSDTYFVDNTGDVVSEFWNDALGGVDTVNSSVSFGPLGFGIENLNLTGFAAINGTGNSNNNVINGNSAANVIDGGVGADTMHGGDGSDTYFVDNTGDVVSEFWNDALGGVDTVNSSVSFGPLGFGIENLNLTGIANINGIGNANNNIINGNVGNNVLNGGAGNDTLFGSNGNDVLIGGTGADTMNGGDQSDTYSVDNVGDVVAETFNDALGGVDTVNSSVSHTLGFGIERLNLTGIANINGIGNANNNVINGNAGNNILIGGAGNDTINGGSGNDLIIGGLGKDTMTGGLGADRFDFNSVAESPSLGAFDVVSGFNWSQGDKIDLVTIDANLLLAGNQAFGLGQLAFNSVTNIFTANVVGGADLSINLIGVQPGFSVALDVIA